MKKLYEALTGYIIQKGMIEESDREMYEYAFELMAEVGLFAMVCIAIAVYLQMVVEGIFFFLIFIPLRSYAGGLHMETFRSCFCLSCLVFIGVLLSVRNIEISGNFSITVLLLLEFIVYKLYPVENVNRVVDEEESIYFKKKLRLFLFLDFLFAAVCFILGKERYLLLIMTTFLLVVITMVAGKCKNRFTLDV